jgi:hypothetical protein
MRNWKQKNTKLWKICSFEFLPKYGALREVFFMWNGHCHWGRVVLLILYNFKIFWFQKLFLPLFTPVFLKRYQTWRWRMGRSVFSGQHERGGYCHQKITETTGGRPWKSTKFKLFCWRKKKQSFQIPWNFLWIFTWKRPKMTMPTITSENCSSTI